MMHRSFAMLAMALASFKCSALSTTRKSKLSPMVEMRRRALSQQSQQHRKQNSSRSLHLRSPATPKRLTREFVAEVLDEGIFRQELALRAIDRQRSQREDSAQSVGDNIERRITELDRAKSQLIGLKRDLSGSSNLEEVSEKIAELGLRGIFTQPRSSWKSNKTSNREFGRPRGFTGEVFYSPLGTPILVGKQSAHRDDVMRQAAQGKDLWFQVDDYNGSRVLLRSSLARGTDGSKRCRQMAADLAAKFSMWGEYEQVPIMYVYGVKMRDVAHHLNR
ncbi:hypothetical protein THAOC_04374 [Thalassiosira oceanica]|uniref:NFACT RNA-binding domain-containing protein n=1 Tax=Thalassiosira oceanica TaxID=159749 RepID=K0T5C8_THAOC|nr:hypothetical protein THAOC_04374 [Thalassiosira oceanica]|eukprot:EJK73978.1 hypothetical protein THAOC_04374 [Thalassiosira oceanica]